QLMAHPGKELALCSIGAIGFFLRFAQSFLDSLPLGDVVRHAEEGLVRRGPIGRPENVDECPIFPDITIHEILYLSRDPSVDVCLRRSRSIVGMHQVSILTP